MFLDSKKYNMLDHTNILQENKRLDQEMKFYFVNIAHRDFIFELGGVNSDGTRSVNIKNLDLLAVSDSKE